jgi:hypothetical protein
VSSHFAREVGLDGGQVMMDPQDLRALLIERLDIVQEIARLNARQLQNRQSFGGFELEIMQCERDMPRTGDAAELAEHLALLRAQLDEAATRLANDDTELMEWNSRLDALDQRLGAG